MDGLIEFMALNRTAIAVGTVGVSLALLVVCGVVWKVMQTRRHQPLTTPPAFQVTRSIEPRDRMHASLVDFVKLVSGTLLQEQMTSPEMFVEKLLDLARTDPQYRVVYVEYAFRFARKHAMGTAYFTRCPKEVLGEAIIANLGFLHEWGHDGNVIIEHGLARSHAQQLIGAEAAG